MSVEQTQSTLTATVPARGAYTGEALPPANHVIPIPIHCHLLLARGACTGEALPLANHPIPIHTDCHCSGHAEPTLTLTQITQELDKLAHDGSTHPARSPTRPGDP